MAVSNKYQSQGVGYRLAIELINWLKITHQLLLKLSQILF